MKLSIPLVTQRLSQRLNDQSRQLSRHLRTGVLVGTCDKGREFLCELEMNMAECASLAAELEHPRTPEQRQGYWRRLIRSLTTEWNGI